MKRRLVWVAAGLLLAIVALEAIGMWLQRPNRVTPAGDPPYLLATTWDQAGEYAAFAPDGDRVGCWAAAVAQIAYLHRLTPTGRVDYATTAGIPIREDLDTIPFPLDRLVARIDADTPPGAVDATARYVYAVAAVLHEDFPGQGILDRDTFVDRLRRQLGAVARLHEYPDGEFPDHRDEATAIIRSEIDAGRPLLLYFDNGKDWGHAAALDGYVVQDGRLLVHLNMGWGGSGDGWYDPFDRIMGVRDDLQNRFLLTIRPQRDTDGDPGNRETIPPGAPELGG
jgi:hypothetical protein